MAFSLLVLLSPFTVARPAWPTRTWVTTASTTLALAYQPVRVQVPVPRGGVLSPPAPDRALLDTLFTLSSTARSGPEGTAALKRLEHLARQWPQQPAVHLALGTLLLRHASLGSAQQRPAWLARAEREFHLTLTLDPRCVPAAYALSIVARKRDAPNPSRTAVRWLNTAWALARQTGQNAPYVALNDLKNEQERLGAPVADLIPVQQALLALSGPYSEQPRLDLARMQLSAARPQDALDTLSPLLVAATSPITWDAWALQAEAETRLGHAGHVPGSLLQFLQSQVQARH